MTPMFRLMQPSTHGRKAEGAKIHYEAPNGRRSLCSQVCVYTTIDGEKMRVWYRTKRAVTCASCTKALEITTRKAIHDLTADQLEDILAHIDTFRIGLGQPG
jgi:Fe-S-cluster-containing hydrogenase component 2